MKVSGRSPAVLPHALRSLAPAPAGSERTGGVISRPTATSLSARPASNTPSQSSNEEGNKGNERPTDRPGDPSIGSSRRTTTPTGHRSDPLLEASVKEVQAGKGKLHRPRPRAGCRPLPARRRPRTGPPTRRRHLPAVALREQEQQARGTETTPLAVAARNSSSSSFSVAFLFLSLFDPSSLSSPFTSSPAWPWCWGSPPFLWLISRRLTDGRPLNLSLSLFTLTARKQNGAFVLLPMLLRACELRGRPAGWMGGSMER